MSTKPFPPSPEGGFHRLSPYEGYRRCALLRFIFGFEVTNLLISLANKKTGGDIEALLNLNSKEIPLKQSLIDSIKRYMSEEDVSDFESELDWREVEEASEKALRFYKQYLEAM